MKIIDYYWPDTTNFYLKGNMYDENFTYIAINIFKWVSSANSILPCASDEEITYNVNHSIMNLAFVNNYFDGNDYENPIKSFMDSSIYDYPTDGYQKAMFGYIKENTVSTQDDIFSYSSDGNQDSFICKKFKTCNCTY